MQILLSALFTLATVSVTAMLVQLLTALLLTWYVSAQDANCDFAQNVQIGQVYYVYSPSNYPSLYKPGVRCRWAATCPIGYNCRLDCDVDIPQSSSCSMDRLMVSKTGDMQLNAANYYCGKGKFISVSLGQKITVGLITSTTSPGGKFMCTLTAQPQSSNATCTCGYKRQNRIVGGVETGINEYPMMAGVVYVELVQIRCGGVIISPLHVLTAAHCTTNRTPQSLAVVVGEHNVNIGDSPATQGYSVANITSHPSFTETNYDYDIAILRTASPIVFSDRVGPVCLPFKYTTTDFAAAPYSKVTILGWGTLTPGGVASNVLRKVELDVISQTSCQSMASTLITPRQMCTYTLGKDACQNDSGGPLLYYDAMTGALFSVGIVSAGEFCATINKPGINTRVTSHLDWIRAKTPEAIYCYK